MNSPTRIISHLTRMIVPLQTRIYSLSLEERVKESRVEVGRREESV